MYFNCRVLSVTALLCLLSGCAIQEPSIRHSGAQTRAVILAGSPQIYARESLINQRRDDMAWIGSLLKQAAEDDFYAQFGADIVRQIEVVTAISASLNAGYDQGEARANSRQDELDRLKYEKELIGLRQSIAELAQSKTKKIQAARTTEPEAAGVASEVGANNTTGDGASGDAADGNGDDPAVDEETIDAAQVLLKTLDDRLAQLRTGMSTPLTAVSAGPRERLRDMLAYREDLNALHNELQLDDLHDADGRALYKLRIPVTIFPGATHDRYAALNYRVRAPRHDSADYTSLYLRWLGHLTYRMNQGQDSRDTSQMSNRELQFFGVSSRLFYPVTFYVSPQAGTNSPTRRSLVDPCLGAASWVEAAAVAADCIPFTVALPYEEGIELGSLFPRLEHLIIPLFEKMPASEAGCPADRSFVYDSKEVCFWDKSLPNLVRNKLNLEIQALPYINQSILVRSIGYLADEKDGCRSARQGAAYVAQCLADGIYANYLKVKCQDIKQTKDEPCASFINNNRRFVSTKEAVDPKVDGTSRTNDKADAGGLRLIDPSNAGNAFMELSIKSQDLALLKNSYLASTPANRAAVRAATSDLQRSFRIVSETAPLISPQSRATGDLNEILLTARHRLADAQLAALIDRESLNKIRDASISTLPYTASILQGLSQREEIAILARDGAENVVQSLLQLIRAFKPTSSAEIPTCGNASLHKFRRLLRGTRESAPYIYSVAPTELAQRVSISSSAAEAISLAAALSATKPLSGLNAGMGASFGRQITNRAQAMERLPLVVGYAQAGHQPSRDESTSSCLDADTETEEVMAGFGWIFGPRQRVKAGAVRDIVELDFPPASFEVTVDLAVPGWWRRVELLQQAEWIGKVDNRNQLLDDEKSPVVTVELPAARSNLDALTRTLARNYGGAPPTARIVAVLPAQINLCPEKIGIAIRGPDLWRGAQVSIAGMRANAEDVSVLPDMDGLQVSFNTDQLRSALAGIKQTQVSVFTQNGVDSYPLTIDRTIVGGECAAQSDSTAWAAKIVPTEVHRCAGNTEFSIQFPAARRLDETEIYVGGSKVKGKCALSKAIGGAGADSSCSSFSFSARLDVALLRGRDSFPIYVTGDGVPLSFEIQRKGSGDRCGDGGSKPAAATDPKDAKVTKVDKVWTGGGDGSLLACRKDAHVTLQGSRLEAIKSVELMGVAGTPVTASAAGDVRVFHFSDLPRLGDTEKPPTDTQTLGVTLNGGKSLTVPSLKWVACG